MEHLKIAQFKWRNYGVVLQSTTHWCYGGKSSYYYYLFQCACAELNFEAADGGIIICSNCITYIISKSFIGDFFVACTTLMNNRNAGACDISTMRDKGYWCDGPNQNRTNLSV